MHQANLVVSSNVNSMGLGVSSEISGVASKQVD